MAKNMGREFATMGEEERRRFEGREGEGVEELPEELDFPEDGPRSFEQTRPTDTASEADASASVERRNAGTERRPRDEA